MAVPPEYGSIYIWLQAVMANLARLNDKLQYIQEEWTNLGTDFKVDIRQRVADELATHTEELDEIIAEIRGIPTTVSRA